MTTTTFCSNKTRFLRLYQLVMRRNAGYFVLISAAILIFYPIQYIMEVFRTLPPDESLLLVNHDLMSRFDLTGLGSNYTPLSAVFFPFLMLVTPVVLALMFSSYLHSKKAADVFHALPVRRGTLLQVDALAAITMMSAPVVLSYLIIGTVSTIKFGFRPYLLGQQAIDLAGWLICSALNYIVVTFVSVQMGTVFDSLMFSVCILVALPAVVGTVLMFLSSFLLGFSVSEESLRFLLLLSPLMYPFDRFSLYDSVDLQTDLGMQMLTRSNGALIGYLLAALVLFYLTIKLYVRRPSERAETTTSRGVLAVACEMVGVFLGGIYGGMMFNAIGGGNSRVSYFIWSVVSGFLVHAIMEAILNRGFKTLARRLPVGAVMVGVTAAFGLVVMTGAFGYENRVPELSKIASVEVMNGSDLLIGEQRIVHISRFTENGEKTVTRTDTFGDWIPLTNESSIRAVRAFHEKAAEEQIEKKLFRSEPNEMSMVWGYVGLRYNMNDGTTLKRYYRAVSAENAALFLPLQTDAQWMEKTSSFFNIDPGDIRRWSYYTPAGELINEGEASPAKELSELLLAAAQADLLARSVDDLRSPEQVPLGYLQFRALDARHVKSDIYAESGTIPVYEDENSRLYQLLTTRSDLFGGFFPSSGTAEFGLSAGCKGAVYSYYNKDTQNSAIAVSMGESNQATQVERFLSLEQVASQDSGVLTEGGETATQEYLYINGDTEQQRQTKDKAVLAELAKGVRSSWYAGDEYLKVSFLFENQTDSWTMIVPVSVLPEAIQQRVRA